MTDHAIEGVLIAFSYVLIWEYIKCRWNANHYEEAYWAERRGRARVEREMKNLSEVQLNTADGFFVQPIAHIKSCYRQCVGTPRQGALVPTSRASLVLTTNMSPESLDGLEEFSHLWITFRFHLNTNTLKEAKAFQGAVKDSQKYTFRAKITPPMLKEKKGVLATRSPHRPNPVGVTLAKIEAVSKATRTVNLSCCDLVDGTPVLDIKPYVPAYDTVEQCRVPDWISETIQTRNTVELTLEITEQVVSIQGKLREYKNDWAAFVKGLTETLEAEVRSKFQTERRMRDASRGLEVEVPFDNALVKYLWIHERVLRITQVCLYSPNLTEGVQTRQQQGETEIESVYDDADEGELMYEIDAEERVM